jgi:hypothetical protein
MTLDEILEPIKNELITVKQAAEFASGHIGKNVTISNISYLIQYGRIKKIGSNGTTQIDLNELNFCNEKIII